jgi:ABC-type nitrate/sulfonate/bicarbonate transport system substrate-binding protein
MLRAKSPLGGALAALVLLGVILVGGAAPRAAGAAVGPAAYAAAAPAAAAAAPAAQQPSVVRIGLPQSISDSGVLIARARGYFRDQGLTVEIVPFQSAPDTIPALASGELEAAGGTISTALFNAIERGVGLKMVADKGSSRPGFEYSQIVVRRDLLESGAVREVADLRGRKIGVASLRSGVESLVAQVLALGGLSVDDVDLTVLGYPEGVVALGNRAIDANSTIEPLLSLGVAQGASGTWEPGRSSSAYGGVYQAGNLVVGPRFAAQPEQVRRFLVAYLRGVRDYNDATRKGMNRPEIFAMLAKHLTVKDVALWERMVPTGLNPDGRIHVETIREDIERWIDLGMLKPEDRIDPNQVIDHTFVDYAVSRLGPYQ